MCEEPYVGEICEFAFPWTPQGWTECDGKTLPISQYQALYSLIGNTYGGDGHTNFAVPDLRPYTSDWYAVESPSVQVSEIADPTDPNKHTYFGRLADPNVSHLNSGQRVDWNQKQMPRKCIALVGIYPARP